MIQPKKYARKPFVVDAVLVTAENMEEVAKWCGGSIATRAATEKRPESKYIRVRVHHPLNERQTHAFEGDHVLYAGTGYKVYTPKAFEASFEEIEGDNMVEVEVRQIQLGMANEHNMVRPS